MSNTCTESIEGAKVPGTRSTRMWRRRCRAKPMRDRAELVGFRPGKCFQHQPSEVRATVYRLARERRSHV